VETDCLICLGLVALGQGAIDLASTYLEEALEQASNAAYKAAESKALVGLGDVLLASDQPEAARSRHAAALALSEHLDKNNQARIHVGLARAYQASAQLDEARMHWRHALDLYTEGASPEAEQVRAELSRLG
jgi:tetratricopeptide (TPR) repeat protein